MAGEATDQDVGRVIAGRYLLLNRLGSSGTGPVWLARDQRLDCEVALREITLRNPNETDPDHWARIAQTRAEARRAAALRSNPHVVTLHDVVEHEGLPWIVMEYVPGAVDLQTLVAQRGPLAPAECARIGLAVLDALIAGHKRGVMHRDVKPARILLAPDRTGSPYARVLLTDFGISLQPDSSGTRYTHTSLVGTAGYLAPERAQGGPPTAAADLFSLGCTLYYAVEGSGPFDRDSELATLSAVVLEETRPMRRAGVLEPLLAALLVKDPARRATAAQTEAALSTIATPQTGTRTPAHPRPAARRTAPAKKAARPHAGPRRVPTPSIPRRAGAGSIAAPSAASRGTNPPHFVMRNFLIALGCAAATAAVLAPAGTWWWPALLGVMWVNSVVLGVVYVCRQEPTNGRGRGSVRDLASRRKPRRAEAFLEGLTDSVFLTRSRLAVPYERLTKEELLRQAYSRLGPPGIAGRADPPQPPDGRTEDPRESSGGSPAPGGAN
ncbi:protein kinase domain-containing protein [Streptomyces chartreusis]|uniref:protein kinase domain-containing protein n=1 Tax=Streptomyces chartreusis TaxID=1969 RepID=UPI00382A866F